MLIYIYNLWYALWYTSKKEEEYCHEQYSNTYYNEVLLPAVQRIAYLNQVVDGFASDTHSITVKPMHEVTLS